MGHWIRCWKTPSNVQRLRCLFCRRKNDYSIQPAEVLGKIAKAHGGQAKIYPGFGKAPQEGHWGFATTSAGIAVWGEDVLQFIDAALR